MGFISLKKLSEQIKIDFYQLEKYIKYMGFDVTEENKIKSVNLDSVDTIKTFLEKYSINEIAYMISHDIPYNFEGTLLLNLRKKYNLNEKQFKSKCVNANLEFKYVYNDEECKKFDNFMNQKLNKAELRDLKYIKEGWIPLRDVIKEFSEKYDLCENTAGSILDYLKIEIYKPLHQLSFINEKQKKQFEDFLKQFNSSNERKLYFQEQTCMEKYGVKNPSQSDFVREKISIKSTENATKRLKKAKKTNLEKYGVENPFQLWSFCDYWNSLSNEEKEIRNSKISESKQKYKFEDEYKLYLAKLGDIFDKDESGISRAINKLNIYHSDDGHVYIMKSDLSKLLEYYKLTENSIISYSEKELVNFIHSIYDSEIIENSRNIISPSELDIYIPDKNVAIEFDGIYWHNELYKDLNYHLNKTKKCSEKGIDLIHVFEDDWKYKKEIVKSMIASRLGIYQQKVFARKCEIKNITKNEAEKFFNINHLQGFANCDNYIALIYNNEIMQCIAIQKKGWHDGNVELTRMATKLNTQVIGGFSKLMKFVYNKYKSPITSYIYQAWFNGKGYKACGFEIVKENPPSYSYIVNGKRIHKSYFRKNKIKKMYEKGELIFYDENKTEHENMLNNHIYRIYDCGTIKVIYKNETK